MKLKHIILGLVIGYLLYLGKEYYIAYSDIKTEEAKSLKEIELNQKLMLQNQSDALYYERTDRSNEIKNRNIELQGKIKNLDEEIKYKSNN